MTTTARAGDDPELVQVRHEEMAAFMACGHAKFTCDIDVPPIPPHVRWEQAKAVLRAVMSGDPDADIVRVAVAQEALGWLPGRG